MIRKMFLFLATGALVYLFAFGRTWVVAQSPSVQPFTATMKEVRFDAAGTERTTEVYTYAVRSDGSSMKVANREFPDGKRYAMRIVMDLSQHKRISIDPATQSITTYALPESVMKKSTDELSSCVGAGLTAGPKVVGFETVHRSITHGKGSNAKSIGEEWVAPALNCFALKLVTYKHGDTTGPHNEVEAVAVAIGEPDAALFQAPTGYVERSPRQVMEILEKISHTGRATPN